MPKKKPLTICLISGASSVGKSMLEGKLRGKIPGISIMDIDNAREAFRVLYNQLGLTAPDWILKSTKELALEDFKAQSKEVCEQTLPFIINEKMKKGDRRGMIITGVNIIPGHFDASQCSDVKVIQLLLKIDDREKHWKWYNEKIKSDNRPESKIDIQQKFEKIREIQDYLTSEAQKHNIPIIENDRNAINKIIKEMDIKRGVFSLWNHKRKQQDVKLDKD